jgi:hypothetical protein
LPVVGDWDGDGVDGIGTFVASNATWTLRPARFDVTENLENFLVFGVN